MNRKFLLFLPAFLQLLILSTFDLGVDEAHYMLYARHLDLSYFDHPPLVGWVHFLFNSVLGENLWAARLPAVAIGLFSTFQIFEFLKRQKFSENEALFAAVITSFSFQIFVLNTFLLPDTLCVLLIWPLMQTTKNLVEKKRLQDWLLLGLWLGLSGLAKYTSVLLLVPVAVVIISHLGFSFLKKPGFYLAVILAAVIVSPVLMWNKQHQWASFRFQSGHVLSTQEVSWKSFLQSWSLQFGIYSPFLWPVAMWGFYQLCQKMRKQASVELQFAGWTAISIFIFFLYASFQNTVLPHWPILFYLFTMPLGLAMMKQRWPRLITVCGSITAGILIMLSVLLVTGIGYRIPGALKDVGGWPEISKTANEKLNEQSFMAVTNWTYASRALFYNPKNESRIFVLGDHNDQFDFWKSGSPEGKDVLILQFVGDEKNISQWIACESLKPSERKEIFVRGGHLYDVSFQWCRKAKLTQ